MKHVLLTAVFGAGLVLSAGGSVVAADDPVAAACMSKSLYSDATCACVAAKADNLTDGQYELLVAAVDDEVNAVSTYEEEGLNLADAARVNGFIWTTAPSCIADQL